MYTVYNIMWGKEKGKTKFTMLSVFHCQEYFHLILKKIIIFLLIISDLINNISIFNFKYKNHHMSTFQVPFTNSQIKKGRGELWKNFMLKYKKYMNKMSFIQ